MDYAAIFGVVMGNAVPLVGELFAAAVGGGSYGTFALAAFDNLDTAMVNRHGKPPFGWLYQTCWQAIFPTGNVVCRQVRKGFGECSSPS